MKTATLSIVTGLIALAGWIGSISGSPAQPQSTAQLLGGFTHMRVFSTPGMDSFKVPRGVRRIMVELRGGGGGGGSGNGMAAVGQGGSGGGYGKQIFQVAPGTNHGVVVGAGGLGAGGTCNVGSAGGSSSLGALISATGGGGGGGCGSTSTPGSSTAALNFSGQKGDQYFSTGSTPENPGGLSGDGSTTGRGGNGNAFFGRDGAAGNVVIFW